MSVLFEKAPLLPWQLLAMVVALGVLPRAGAAEAKRPCVTWIVQRVQGHRVGQLLPANLARTGNATFGELQTIPTKSPYRRQRRAGALERGEKDAQTLLNLLVGIQHHFILLINQADRQGHFQLTTLGFVEHAANQPRP